MGDWEDGDPSGIRAYDGISAKPPLCSDFHGSIPLDNTIFEGLNDDEKNSICPLSSNLPSSFMCKPRGTTQVSSWGDTPNVPEEMRYDYAKNNNINPVFALSFDVIKSLREEISGRGDTEVPLFEMNPDQGIRGLDKDSLMGNGDIVIAPFIYLTLSPRDKTTISSGSNDNFLFELDLSDTEFKSINAGTDDGAYETTFVTCDDSDLKHLKSVLVLFVQINEFIF